MGSYRELTGNLITLAKDDKIFDVIAQGCNCFCIQKAGLAPQMVEAFGTDKFRLEADTYKGFVNKLGTIDYNVFTYGEHSLTVVNAYTQFSIGSNVLTKDSIALDYEALTLCLRKINKLFAGKRIGLPKIGAGLAGAAWEDIKIIIQKELRNCDTTVILYNS